MGNFTWMSQSRIYWKARFTLTSDVWFWQSNVLGGISFSVAFSPKSLWWIHRLSLCLGTRSKNLPLTVFICCKVRELKTCLRRCFFAFFSLCLIGVFIIFASGGRMFYSSWVFVLFWWMGATNGVAVGGKRYNSEQAWDFPL